MPLNVVAEAPVADLGDDRVAVASCRADTAGRAGEVVAFREASSQADKRRVAAVAHRACLEEDTRLEGTEHLVDREPLVASCREAGDTADQAIAPEAASACPGGEDAAYRAGPCPEGTVLEAAVPPEAFPADRDQEAPAADMVDVAARPAAWPAVDGLRGELHLEVRAVAVPRLAGSEPDRWRESNCGWPALLLVRALSTEQPLLIRPPVSSRLPTFCGVRRHGCRAVCRRFEPFPIPVAASASHGRFPERLP